MKRFEVSIWDNDDSMGMPEIFEYRRTKRGAKRCLKKNLRRIGVGFHGEVRAMDGTIIYKDAIYDIPKGWKIVAGIKKFDRANLKDIAPHLLKQFSAIAVNFDDLRGLPFIPRGEE